jgi:hypothetical protein
MTPAALAGTALRGSAARRRPQTAPSTTKEMKWVKPWRERRDGIGRTGEIARELEQ